LVINDLNNARKLLKDADKYHFIEIMACAGGCIGGVGQPMPMTKQKLQSRINALYTEDKHLQVRRSHNNPAVQKIYKNYLGQPLGKTSKKLLHTFYYKRRF
jgi:NADP-reducing hydrogenase subunit HndD